MTMDKDNKKTEHALDERIQDMTTGSPWKLILRFMVPLMGGNLLQQLYTVTDAAILGKGVGVEALSAVGATDWIYWLMLWAAAGFGQGFSVLAAKRFGEKDYHMLRKSTNMSLLLSLVCGVALAVIGVIAAGPLLRLLNTPAVIYETAHLYVTIMYVGIFVILQYNTVSCILRALGDSKTPFIALIISTCLNIGLDLLFVLVFHMGVAGAAAASILAQAISYGFCLRVLKKLSILKSSREEKELDKRLLKDLWNKGFATAFQYSVIAIGGIVVQYVINTMGFLYVAGFTATNKLYGLLESISLAMGNTMMVYTSQNYGARDKRRIKQGVRASLMFGILTSAVLGAIMIVFGRQILMLFISAKASAAEQVLEIAYRYLFVMSSTLFLLYLVNTYRNILMGLDRMKLVLVGSIGELVGRIMTGMLVLYVIGTNGAYFIEVSAWLCADLVYCTGYYVLIRKLSLEKTG